MNIVVDLFLTFVKIGLFTFGGGYAMLAMIEQQCVDKKRWMTHDEMMNVTVIAESTPGPIAINCATFTGYKSAGFLGACAATIGIVLPSFVIIYVISKVLNGLLEISVIANAFKGIKIAVGLLILDAAVTMIQKMPKKKLSVAIMVGACISMLLINFFAWDFSSVYVMLIGGFISLVVFIAKEALKAYGSEKR